jgi:hypothetical protein
MAPSRLILEFHDMALSHSLGFPRIGRDRELKKALEAHWQGELDEAGLRAVGQRLRAEHWQLQKDAGIDLLPVGDFAWYDQVLAHSLAFGVIPIENALAGAIDDNFDLLLEYSDLHIVAAQPRAGGRVDGRRHSGAKVQKD